MFKKIAILLFLFLISFTLVSAAATSDAYYQAGNKLYAQGNYDLCIKYYKAAIQVDPQNWKAYQALGSCEYHMGKSDDAIRDFNQSLAINPNNPPLQGFVNKISASASAPPAPAARTQSIVYGDSRLPKQGGIDWLLGWSVNSMSYQDLVTDFAPVTLTFASEPIGVELYIGADYNLSQNFELGAQIQYIDKEPESISSIYTSGGYVFQESCAGLAVEGKYLLPLSDQFRLSLGAQVGYYTLVGTTYSYSDSFFAANYNLSGSSVGEVIGAELEWVMDHGGWAIDFGLGYRALSFGTITYTAATSSSSYSGSGSATSSAQTLHNYAGTGNFTMDFSGPRVNVGVRFF
ncbi:MAG TPA: tetratricopeptide repeat protein [bacterium]|jgi:tetratricopeptide (TPR) repeat protein|nr:tetratricopeptide repeat protein [bacterium]